MLTYPCKNRCKRVLYKQKPFGVKLAIELLITEDNMVQRYFNKQQRKELANLLSTKAYKQIFTNGKVKYPFFTEEEFGVERARFTATFETYRIEGKNKVVMVDEPKFAQNNSEKAVGAVYQAKISSSTDYKHNKTSTIQNIKNLTNGQVKNIMINVVNYDKDSFKKQIKELGVGRVNVEKMFNGSKEMVPLFKNLFNEEKWLEGFTNKLYKWLLAMVTTSGY